MNLGGAEIARGDLVPQRVIDKIPSSRFGSLVRVGYLQETTPSQVRTSSRKKRSEQSEPDTHDTESED